MYVARFTLDPQDDIERGWSGYMGYNFKSPVDACEFLGLDIDNELDGMSEEDLLDLLMDKENTDLRFDKRTNGWRVYHHDGLSCWELEAETIEQAIAEAHKPNVVWGGDGFRTLGTVKFICAVEDVKDLYIFECDDASPNH